MKDDLKDLQKLVVLNTKVLMQLVQVVAYRDSAIPMDDLVHHLRNLEEYSKQYAERYKP